MSLRFDVTQILSPNGTRLIKVNKPNQTTLKRSQLPSCHPSLPSSSLDRIVRGYKRIKVLFSLISLKMTFKERLPNTKEVRDAPS